MKYRNIIKYQYELMGAEKFKVDLPNAAVISNSVGHYVYIKNGMLTIKKHYAWDGSSVPLKKWWGWVWDSDKYCKIASLVHDALCQLIRENLLSPQYRGYADGLYKDMCIEGGMSKWQANMRYKALRRFGGKTKKITIKYEIMEI